MDSDDESRLKNRSFVELLNDDQDEICVLGGSDDDLENDVIDALEELLRPKERMQRRIWAVPRTASGIWSAMNDVWPTLPGTMEDEKYYEYFRMYKSSFDEIFNLVEGNFQN